LKIRSLRIREEFDEATAELEHLESRLLLLHNDVTSAWLGKCLADLNFEWAELQIATNQLDLATGRYDQSISFLSEIASQSESPKELAEMISNCHRLKAWHLSRAGLFERAFSAWDLAIKNAFGRTRVYLRAERALERALLNDYTGAAFDADQVVDGTNVDPPILLHLARVYSESLRAVRMDDRLESEIRQNLANDFVERAVSCLRRISDESNAENWLDELDTDTAFTELLKSDAFKSWRLANESKARP
jgi:tetratricopeptide (TPR) repeat protein